MYVWRGAHTAALGASGATGLPGFGGSGLRQLARAARSATRTKVAVSLMELKMLPRPRPLGDKSTYVCPRVLSTSYRYGWRMQFRRATLDAARVAGAA
jgi:hypothetical protein